RLRIAWAWDRNCIWKPRLVSDSNMNVALPVYANKMKMNMYAELEFCIAPPHSAGMTALLFDTLRLFHILRDKGHFRTGRRSSRQAFFGMESVKTWKQRLPCLDIGTIPAC
ncbi:MAG: hypothetical protein ACREDV_09260, partial [Methylocella sp.]